MPDQPDKRKIFLTLADRLPENILRELFPELSPGDIRELLKAAADSARPAAAKSSPTGTDPQFSQYTLPFAEVENGDICSLYTDGASRGNPGEAGAGIVLMDSSGNELQTRSLYLGKCTNNAAEYRALVTGLESALAAGCKKLNIFLDSELIVRQVQGIYKVKNEQLKPLHAQVEKLLTGLRFWTIKHIPREKNFRADELANKAVDDHYVTSRKS
ncbi:MAG: ribonuclease HI family protein [Desulfobulbaceae bacterium]|nr:ribonuclease HI family protein [Desulfobulbaceae bacterium]